MCNFIPFLCTCLGPGYKDSLNALFSQKPPVAFRLHLFKDDTLSVDNEDRNLALDSSHYVEIIFTIYVSSLDAGIDESCGDRLAKLDIPL